MQLGMYTLECVDRVVCLAGKMMNTMHSFDFVREKTNTQGLFEVSQPLQRRNPGSGLDCACSFYSTIQVRENLFHRHSTVFHQQNSSFL